MCGHDIICTVLDSPHFDHALLSVPIIEVFNNHWGPLAGSEAHLSLRIILRIVGTSALVAVRNKSPVANSHRSCSVLLLRAPR